MARNPFRIPQPELTEELLEVRDVLRKTVQTAMPALLSSLVVFGMNFLNYIMMAIFLDYKYIASYGIVYAYTTLSAGMFLPLVAGTAYLLEKARKEKDPYKVQKVISTSMILSVIIGIGSTVFAILITPGYIWQVWTPEEIKVVTSTFLRYFSFTFTPILYFGVTTIILIQSGERTGPILAEISALALHASFSYIFVGLFDWDIRGSAISAIVAQSAAGLINTYLVLRLRKDAGGTAAALFDWETVKEMWSAIWKPVGVAFLVGCFAIFLQFYIDELGMETIAAFTLLFVFQDLLFIPIHATRAPSRQLSAEYYDRGKNNALVAAMNPVMILAVIYALLLIPFTRVAGPLFFNALGHNAEVTEIAMNVLNLLSTFYVFYAISTVLTASLEGLGKQGITSVFNLCFNIFARLGVLILGVKLVQGELSIAGCFPASWALSAAVLSIYYFAHYSIERDKKYSI